MPPGEAITHMACDIHGMRSTTTTSPGCADSQPDPATQDLTICCCLTLSDRIMVRLHPYPSICQRAVIAIQPMCTTKQNMTLLSVNSNSRSPICNALPFMPKECSQSNPAPRFFSSICRNDHFEHWIQSIGKCDIDICWLMALATEEMQDMHSFSLWQVFHSRPACCTAPPEPHL